MRRQRRICCGLAFLAFFALGYVSYTVAEDQSGSNGRQVLRFNQDWKFSKGDPAGTEAIDFDDSAWDAIRLPHDWAIAGPFYPEEDGFAGKLPWRGVGWYRKTFTLDPAAAGTRVYLDFDGVMAFPQVYVNGKLAGGWDYGYNSFRIDATPYVKFGEPNVVAVRVDTRNHGTRWYPGAGIYRKVTLTICNPVHIGHWATFVTTPQVTDDKATVVIRTTIENHTDADANVKVAHAFTDPDGRGISTVDGRAQTVAAGKSAEFEQEYQFTMVKRWDIDDPNLYTAQTLVSVDNRVVDEQKTTFGIRTFEFTADDGFHLNGRRVQLYGVNLHHDQGPLGGAFYTRAMERQLEIMRDMGVNALRTSHNVPAPEVLDLCDRMGIVVWNECFDKWDDKADRVNFQPPLKEYGEKQLRNFVMRDRNHPSVFIWSIANEISDMRGPAGLTEEHVTMMRDFVRKYDDTRPVGLGHHISETAYSDTFDALDLTGWNYSRRYSIYRERYPNKPIVYSESASALSTRGFYELPLPKSRTTYSSQHQVDSYDYNSAEWSDIADVEFALMERDPFVAGEFVWTGIDYLGEPTPFSQEACSSYFGIVDLCGIPKDRFYLYRSHWRPDTATVHILPHWNWPERAGQNVPVFVYTNGDSAELFLNGKSLGRREKLQKYSPPKNLAEGKPALASSEQVDRGNEAAKATDGTESTRWSAGSDDADPWLQVDLEEPQPIKQLNVSFDRGARDYKYQIKISNDGVNWQTIVSASDWGGWGNRDSHEVDFEAQFVRLEFTDRRNRAEGGIRELGVFDESYFGVTDKYRLRWPDVVYEPGELKAVAYKNGEQVGEAVMRTAGPPATIRMTPDRKSLTASGEDLCYVLVEGLDASDTLCPLADNLVRFRVDGPAEIAAVGNGNPLSLEPFLADYRKLFFGKAMLILRTKEGEGGAIQITAESDGLAPATVKVESQPAK